MKEDDDDIQEYVSNNFAQTIKQVVRNETVEEVAAETPVTEEAAPEQEA